MTSIVDIHKVKGVRPEFDVYIGRKLLEFMDKDGITFDSKWANHWNDLVGYEVSIRFAIKNDPKHYNLEELQGKRLGCWCITTDSIDNPVCHGQILLKLLQEV